MCPPWVGPPDGPQCGRPSPKDEVGVAGVRTALAEFFGVVVPLLALETADLFDALDGVQYLATDRAPRGRCWGGGVGDGVRVSYF